LLEPSEGKVYADEHNVFQHLASWQRNIGYVPQSIYLLDASIRGNVAFGLEDKDIDNNKVWDALRIAQLEDFAKQLTDGLDTLVGENGIRFSGGQRQRLGIARAVYHQPEILILDEATSALDSETEKDVSGAIEALSGQKTLIIIAHRLSTIRQCDTIFLMRAGTIVDSGTFDELVSKNYDFKRMADSGKL
jgi:ATP-binding cassette subfamily C protein